ncbi:hypothetical protein [Saccharothrix australiensis]|uniref:Uncharacterized protein n=1 Tax=Saccharothrix australiensis TaxID=2072 RepID=A0A495VXM8_9PSEU|nr:hypothetical protein [Saccharothrix australiensis]RKT52378.1 hypothetical protein C8E97_0888 [Saccharothrix australiensis]
MVGEELELLITVVVGADDERQARTACAGLLRRVGGRVVQAGDCSDEEPGCWSVTVSLVSGERATQNVAGALARAVRTFVRSLGDRFPLPRVACEPPTAWTVLEDQALLGELVPGAERLLVEAWAGGDPQHRAARPEATAAEVPAGPAADPAGRAAEDPTEDPADDPAGDRVEPPSGAGSAPPTGTRLLLRVDVATDRSAGAEWQARAVASRVARSGKITRVAPEGDLLSVHVDLGSSADPPAAALLGAVSSLGRSGWTPVAWSGRSAVTRWSAAPVPRGGIAALELTATPASAFVWTVPG